nr:aldehyde dehydrogenase family protein [Psychrobacter sp. PraFG1]UTT87660.1 aldehyde dehydrogenase family protein [Psychrobacter sp. PraFG1]
METGTPLAAGCTVILKPSEITLIPELVLGDILIEIGLPKGVVNILPGAAEVGTAMTMHPLVDKVSFTGSNAVGEKVMRQASSSIKDISLELGGKSAIIVCEDADINSACDIIIAGIFFNAGQICSATSRLLVHKNIADDLYQILRKKTQELVVGDGFDSDTIMGPLVSEQQLKQVQQYFGIAKQEGLSCLTGGN